MTTLVYLTVASLLAQSEPAQQQQQPVILSNPVTITSGPIVTGDAMAVQQLTQPPMTPAIMSYTVQSTNVKGALQCSDKLASGCGTIDADLVGGYTLNTKCERGFYDMIHGGTCWKCPDDTDNGGDWIRSADHIEKDTACWRIPKETFSAATFVKNGWAWDCGSGEFWDSVGSGGSRPFGGACWKCADPYPRRTGYSVTDSKACTRSANETKPAIFLNYNGCPTPDVQTMYPQRAAGDKRLPGKPFLDIASGITVANNTGGACWACPSADAAGNFLITERNGNTLINRKTGNNGCTVLMKYKPAPYTEPGLSGLAGVKEVVFEKTLLVRPDALTKYLYALAQGKGLNGSEATKWVAGQWQDIAAHPYQNATIRALMLQYVLGTAPDYMYPGPKPQIRTVAEQQLVRSLEGYIQSKRTYLAQQALDMYDAWKADIERWKQTHKQSQLAVMMDYGDVPLDFKSAVGAMLVGAADSVAVTGAVAGAQAFASGVKYIDTGKIVMEDLKTLQWGMQGLKAFQAGIQSVGIIGGATAIAAAGAILASVAMDQFMAIQTARPKLETALANAKKPVKLSEIPNTTEPLHFWSLATGVPSEREDAQVLAMAQAAANYAKQKNYAKPN